MKLRSCGGVPLSFVLIALMATVVGRWAVEGQLAHSLHVIEEDTRRQVELARESATEPKAPEEDVEDEGFADARGGSMRPGR